MNFSKNPIKKINIDVSAFRFATILGWKMSTMKSESGDAAWDGWKVVTDGVRTWKLSRFIRIHGNLECELNWEKILIYPTTHKVAWSVNLYLSIVIFNRVKQCLTIHSTLLVQRTFIYLPLYLCDRSSKIILRTYDITQETNYMKIL